MRRRLLAVTAASVAAAVLTACGGMHPGAAVVINDGDYEVSMDELDDLAAAWCEGLPVLAKAQGQAVEPSEGIDARQDITLLLVQSYLTPLAAERADAPEPPPAARTVLPSDVTEITDQMDADRVDDFLRVIELSQETGAWQESIGSTLPEAGSADPAQLGQQYVLDFAADFDIDIDPRIGLDGDRLEAEAEDIARSGSMSIAQSSEATMREDPERQADLVDSLPPTQSCG